MKFIVEKHYSIGAVCVLSSRHHEIFAHLSHNLFCTKCYSIRKGQSKLNEFQPTWGHVVTSKEDEKSLHAYTCKKCRATIFIAKGREWRFFNDFVQCTNCGARGKDNFYDRRSEIVDEVDDGQFVYESIVNYKLSKREQKKIMEEQERLAEEEAAAAAAQAEAAAQEDETVAVAEENEQVVVSDEAQVSEEAVWGEESEMNEEAGESEEATVSEEEVAVEAEEEQSPVVDAEVNTEEVEVKEEASEPVIEFKTPEPQPAAKPKPSAVTSTVSSKGDLDVLGMDEF